MPRSGNSRMLARKQIPNYLTFARVLAVPAALAIILINPLCTKALFWLFLAASITDFFDGYLARKWNVVTQLGTLLDPVADKLLVALLLLFLLLDGAHAALFLPIALILLRELYVAGLREFLAMRRIPLPVSQSGKWKTATQMLAILLLLGAQGYGHPAAHILGSVLLGIAAILAFTSAASYTRKSWVHLK